MPCLPRVPLMTGNLLEIQKGFIFTYDYNTFKYTIYKEEIHLVEHSAWRPNCLLNQYSIPLKSNVTITKESRKFHTGGSEEGTTTQNEFNFVSDWEYFYVLKMNYKSFEIKKGKKVLVMNSRSFGFNSDAIRQKFHDTVSKSFFVNNADK